MKRFIHPSTIFRSYGVDGAGELAPMKQKKPKLNTKDLTGHGFHGGKHKGDVLYPAAKVHMTHSPRQARQIMQYITVSQEEEFIANSTKYKDMERLSEGESERTGAVWLRI